MRAVHTTPESRMDDVEHLESEALLELLRDARCPGSIFVEKLGKIGILKSLVTPKEELFVTKQQKYKVLEVVHGWVVPNGIRTWQKPARSESIWIVNDAIVTEDKHIAVGYNVSERIDQGVLSQDASTFAPLNETGQLVGVVNWAAISKKLGSHLPSQT